MTPQLNPPQQPTKSTTEQNITEDKEARQAACKPATAKPHPGNILDKRHKATREPGFALGEPVTAADSGPPAHSLAASQQHSQPGIS